MGKKKKEEQTRLFVYGSLKKELGNHPLLERMNAEFLGHDKIVGPYTMYSLGSFPAVCTREGITTEVYGEVYAIQPHQLDAFDMLEGHPNWYKREKIYTKLKELRAWVYLMPAEAFTQRAHCEIVPNNMWRPTSAVKRFWTPRGVQFDANP